jgi:putative Mg2+ transporter-C (MgtC) family protein
MNWMMQLEIIGEVAMAMLLGGVIGFERELADKPAGFRTQMLVAGASALLVGLADAMLLRYIVEGKPNLTADPIRITEAIVTGISFLGAGTIFRRDASEQVQGLTTAASILLCAAVGISVALRQFVLAVGVTILALIVLRGLTGVENRLTRKKKA